MKLKAYIGGFEWISINLSKMQHSHSRHQKTTSNFLWISLKGILKFNEISPLGHNSWQNFQEHPENVSFMQFSQKIDGFRQKDSQDLEFLQLEQNSEIFHFHHIIYQNYIGFKNKLQLG